MKITVTQAKCYDGKGKEIPTGKMVEVDDKTAKSLLRRKLAHDGTKPEQVRATGKANDQKSDHTAQKQ